MKKSVMMLLACITTVCTLVGCTDSQGHSSSETVVIIDESVETSGSLSEQTGEGSVSDELQDHESMVRSYLTNEWIDSDAASLRPLAVMIPNESSAIPHYGISEASILYECAVEGDMTRLMGIFEDYGSIGKLGNVRSLRDYYVYWAFEWDAILCHFGAPYYADDILSEETTDDLDGNVLTAPYYRTTDRSAPHNAYLDTTQVADVLSAQGIEATDRGLKDSTHYLFADDDSPNLLTQYEDADVCTYLDMSGSYPLTRCYFEYNEEDGLYYRFQYLAGGTDGPHIDGANGEQLSFANIIIQCTESAVRDDEGYLWYRDVDTSGRDAWYITRGQIIHCTWIKETNYGATRYYDDDGNEIEFNTGKTMVLIIQDDDTFDYH
ncbi:MAG: DUF3048 domain-containing protein [Lachnospiraceae bacterium]|nr:DUF3048 domain-containing protein [Lachnospiraceae bacterium]